MRAETKGMTVCGNCKSCYGLAGLVSELCLANPISPNDRKGFVDWRAEATYHKCRDVNTKGRCEKFKKKFLGMF